MVYRVVLTCNGVYKKTFHRLHSKEAAYAKYRNLIETNKVNFPKRFINTDAIIPVKFQICITKPTESTDTFRTIRDNFGRTAIEKPLGNLTILIAEDFEIEEAFWIYGHDAKANRPTVNEIVQRLMSGIRKKNMIKQIIVVHNKLIIYNEDQFDMVLCKCMADAQRLHHSLAKIAKKQKIKNLMFMGTASPASVSRMYEIIQENTNWPLKKIRRYTTRP